MDFGDMSRGVGAGISIAAMGIGMGIAFDAMRDINRSSRKKKSFGSKDYFKMKPIKPIKLPKSGFKW